MPLTPAVKDRRYTARSIARNYALSSKLGWDKVKTSMDNKSDYLQQIRMLAESSGFFSVWMQVFKEDAEVKEVLLEVFKGTRKEYCLC